MVRLTIRATVLGMLLLGMAAPTLAQESPTLTVTSPVDGATLEGTSVQVDFTTNGVEIVPTDVPVEQAGQQAEANEHGQGHIHIMLDLQPLVILEQGNSYTFENVPPGVHELMVEIVNNDHSSLTPPVVQTVRFTTVGAQVLPQTGGVDTASEYLLIAGLAGVVSGLALLGIGRVWRRTRPVDWPRQ